MLVTGTSAVGISQKSWSSHLNRSSLNLGNWPVPKRLCGVHHEGRQHLGVAVLAGVHVEHEIDERALELGAHVPVEGEARAGDLGGALEIENAELRAQVPVRLGLEIELRRLAAAADLDVVGLGSCPRGRTRAGCWECRPAARGTPRRAALTCSSSAAISSPMARTCFCRSVVSAPSRFSLPISCDSCVLPRLQLLGLGDGGPALAVELAELVEAGLVAPRGEPFGDAGRNWPGSKRDRAFPSMLSHAGSAIPLLPPRVQVRGLLPRRSGGNRGIPRNRRRLFGQSSGCGCAHKRSA